MQAKYDGLPLELHIERIEPMRLFLSMASRSRSMRRSIIPAKPMTLVTFELETDRGWHDVTLTESGFDALPLGRRTDALEANEEGWEAIVPLVGNYLGARLA